MSFDQETTNFASRTSLPYPLAHEMLTLSRDECLALLASQTFGRLAVDARNGPPVMRPVNYVFDRRSQSVVFRTAPGSKFQAAVRSAEATFEIDGRDETSRTAWSVIIQGKVQEIMHPAELRRLNELELEPWAPGYKPHWVRIRAWTVSGRRIVLAGE